MIISKPEEEEARALLKIVISLAYADTELVEHEEQALFAKFRRFRGFGHIRDDLDKLQEEVDNLFDEEKEKIEIDRLINEAADYFTNERKDAQLSEAAFAHAVDVAATDGIVKPIEREVLDELADKLNIEEERKEAIFEVVLTMCKFYYKVS